LDPFNTLKQPKRILIYPTDFNAKNDPNRSSNGNPYIEVAAKIIIPSLE